jgi:hypothetical protein
MSGLFNSPALSSEAADLREQLLEGYAGEVEIAEALGVSVRTVYRLGLPYIKVANRRFYHVAGSREKLTHKRAGSDPPPPRHRGRPRKVA